jgi:hypothetical protein
VCGLVADAGVSTHSLINFQNIINAFTRAYMCFRGGEA